MSPEFPRLTPKDAKAALAYTTDLLPLLRPQGTGAPGTVFSKSRSTPTVERSIRPITLTRKNALFAGSDGGAQHWAVIASLIETCKLSAVDPQAYLAHVITQIVQGHPQSRIDELLPWVYARTVGPVV